MTKKENRPNHLFNHLTGAVKMIEEDGVEAFNTVSEIYGIKIATALLIIQFLNNKAMEIIRFLNNKGIEYPNLVTGADLIHEKGILAFPEVNEIITGIEAEVMIIAELRYQKGAGDSYPFNTKINGEILGILEKEGLI